MSNMLIVCFIQAARLGSVWFSMGHTWDFFFWGKKKRIPCCSCSYLYHFRTRLTLWAFLWSFFFWLLCCCSISSSDDVTPAVTAICPARRTLETAGRSNRSPLIQTCMYSMADIRLVIVGRETKSTH